MALYNMLFGMNKDSDKILGVLGLTKDDVERFRDCGVDEKAGLIWIYTRTGGGNREDYPNELLINNPHYLSDEDDDFDSTYATYLFEIPSEVQKNA